MPIFLEIHLSHPDIVTGDARNLLYNSITQTIEVLGPEWNHTVTTTSNGNLSIRFEKKTDAALPEMLPPKKPSAREDISVEAMRKMLG